MLRINLTIFFLLILSQELCFAENALTKIGVIVPLSGPGARFGESVKSGILTNSSLKDKLIFEDSACLSKNTITAHKKLTDFNKINFLIGPACGSPQTVLAPLIKKHKQIAILPSSAPRSVFKDSGGRMFSTAFSIDKESEFNAKNMIKLGAKNVVVLFAEHDYGRTHERAFKKHFSGNILDTLVYDPNNPETLNSLIIKVKQLKPDSLYVPDLFPIMHGLLKKLKVMHLEKIKIYSTYGAESDYLEDIMHEANGLIYSYPDIKGKNAQIYFAEIAGKVVEKVIEACPKLKESCILNFLDKNYDFNKYGILEGELVLKTIKDGKYQIYKEL